MTCMFLHNALLVLNLLIVGEGWNELMSMGCRGLSCLRRGDVSPFSLVPGRHLQFSGVFQQQTHRENWYHTRPRWP